MAQQESDEEQVKFRDVAACFSEEEWKLLHQWQKDFYKIVMNEIHQALIVMGYQIINADTLLRVYKGKELYIQDSQDAETTCTNDPVVYCQTDCQTAVKPDVVFRIEPKQESGCRYEKSSEEIEVCDGSSSCFPVVLAAFSLTTKEESELFPVDLPDLQRRESSHCSSKFITAIESQQATESAPNVKRKGKNKKHEAIPEEESYRYKCLIDEILKTKYVKRKRGRPRKTAILNEYEGMQKFESNTEGHTGKKGEEGEGDGSMAMESLSGTTAESDTTVKRKENNEKNKAILQEERYRCECLIDEILKTKYVKRKRGRPRKTAILNEYEGMQTLENTDGDTGIKREEEDGSVSKESLIGTATGSSTTVERKEKNEKHKAILHEGSYIYEYLIDELLKNNYVKIKIKSKVGRPKNKTFLKECEGVQILKNITDGHSSMKREREDGHMPLESLIGTATEISTPVERKEKNEKYEAIMEKENYKSDCLNNEIVTKNTNVKRKVGRPRKITILKEREGLQTLENTTVGHNAKKGEKDENGAMWFQHSTECGKPDERKANLESIMQETNYKYDCLNGENTHVKRKRGRPRKITILEECEGLQTLETVKRKRGRPKKIKILKDYAGLPKLGNNTNDDTGKKRGDEEGSMEGACELENKEIECDQDRNGILYSIQSPTTDKQTEIDTNKEPTLKQQNSNSETLINKLLVMNTGVKRKRGRPVNRKYSKEDKLLAKCATHGERSEILL